jgi:serine/threonine protein kinase
MEYVEHGSLFDILHRSRGQLTVEQTLGFARDIAEGMSFLHASGVLHRDLKSANILVDGASRPKICDFGLSQEEQSQASMAEPSAHGTIAWAAPEVLHAKECTKASDVFSFAVVFYELFSRNIPYTSLPMAEVVMGVLGASKLRPSLVGVPRLGDPANPAAAAKIVNRLWAAAAAAKEASTYQPLSLANSSAGYGTAGVGAGAAAGSRGRGLLPPKTVIMRALDLLSSAWEQEPMQRPTFDEILKKLNSMLAETDKETLGLMVLQSR